MMYLHVIQIIHHVAPLKVTYADEITAYIIHYIICSAKYNINNYLQTTDIGRKLVLHKLQRNK